jgi:hypothetical protein
MLYSKTPIGRIEIPSWQEKELINLTDEELLQRAYDENKKFVISPAVFAMIEKRFLGCQLQKMINPNVGQNHFTLSMIAGW